MKIKKSVYQGPFVGDYAGLPINEAAQLRADSWQPSLLTFARASV